jgi:hypothetical protein
MKKALTKSFLTCVATACLVLGLSPSLQAKKIEFPADEPAFTFNLPDGWTTETGKDGSLDCTAGDGSEFKIAFVAAPSVQNADDANALLTKVLKAMSEGMKCENYKADEPKSGKMGKVSLIAAEGHCKVSGTEMSLNVVVFSVAPGKYFSLMGAASKEVDKAHEKDMNNLIGSIAPVE